MSTELQPSSDVTTSTTPPSSPTQTFSPQFFSEAPLTALLELDGPTMDNMSDSQLEQAVMELRKRREQRVLTAKLKEPSVEKLRSKTKINKVDQAADALLASLGL